VKFKQATIQAGINNIGFTLLLFELLKYLACTKDSTRTKWALWAS